MIGLKKELMKVGGTRMMARNNIKSIIGISNLLGCAYGTIKRKIDGNTFTTQESIAILTVLFPEMENNFEFYKYLFTEGE